MQGVLDTKEDRARDKARAELADAYDDFDMRVEQHWTEKVRLPADLRIQCLGFAASVFGRPVL